MRNLIRLIIAFTLLFTSLLVSSAQGTFHVSVKIPASMQSRSFQISYDDGLNELPVTDSFNNNRLKLSGKFYSIAAVLKVTHIDSGSIPHTEIYFIGTKPAKIIFSNNATMQTEGDFKYDTLINAIAIYQSKIKKQRDAFIKTEGKEMSRFCNENADSLFKKDSLIMLFNKKWHNLQIKEIEFIKQHSSDYFSFWWFKDQVLPYTFRYANSTVSDFENLLNIYNTIFPSTFKETAEGKQIMAKLNGKINTKMNYAAPNFEMRDVKGNTIKLSHFKGKYILLDFWATWCAPCMNERSFIKKIRDEYPEDQLVIISVSADVDFKRFEDVVKEKKMNWPNIYGNNDLPLEFGVNVYPTIFLIDKDGILIFEGKGKGNDVLEAMLKRM